MELTEAQYERIAPLLPVQRGNVRISNLQVLNAILYVAEHGCKWRGLPPRFGRWHTVYTRMNRWSKNGVLDRVFEHLQREQLIRRLGARFGFGPDFELGLEGERRESHAERAGHGLMLRGRPCSQDAPFRGASARGVLGESPHSARAPKSN